MYNTVKCTHMVEYLPLFWLPCMCSLPDDIQVRIDEPNVLENDLLRHEQLSVSCEGLHVHTTCTYNTVILLMS